MAICKRAACSYLCFWVALHFSQEQKGEVMAIWNWYSTLFIYAFILWLCSPLLTVFLTGLFIKIGWFRGFMADYGVPLMVLSWTALSFTVPGAVPNGVPRRLFCPLPWESASLYHWTVVKVLTLQHDKFLSLTCDNSLPDPPKCLSQSMNNYLIKAEHGVGFVLT